jgi:hypothetical protein
MVSGLPSGPMTYFTRGRMCSAMEDSNAQQSPPAFYGLPIKIRLSHNLEFP